ncbi:MAG: hypothetical protein DMG50_17360 [Acidobacteria bacterium]|nr:MAG: hypothetical protein DMG50_17360 [Acidobacteriota bacterium]
MIVREAKSALECWRGEEKRGVAAGGRNRIENLGAGLGKARCGLFVCGWREQGEIDCTACTGYECVGKGLMVGNFLQLCEKGDVVRGKDAQFEDGSGGRGFEQHRKSFAEAAPHGRTHGVVEDYGRGRA